MKALVTGSTGFVGRHLIQSLIDRDISVTCLLRPSSEAEVLDEYDVEIIRADYFDLEALRSTLGSYDFIFHVAGVINARKWETYYQANCIYTENLLKVVSEQKIKVKKFIFISSISASGPSKPGLYKTEDDSEQPNSDYGRSKLEAEKMVLKYKDRLPVVIIRPPNIIGPLQKELFDAVNLVKKRIFPLIGNGDIQTSICYVEDLTAACVTIALDRSCRDKTYFFTHKQAYSWREITRELAKQMGKLGFYIPVPFFIQYIVALVSGIISKITGSVSIVSVENLLMSRRDYWLYDSSKIERELGIKAESDLRTAIKKTLSYYKDRNLI
jgi:nucleoside-diphosphate-sugar epimerase